mmetsp:Transcript_5138/g.8991  ORF Transcript_5138/g.8991 Transcript_5138/m.8991 type:complete len:340 (-) Transcript_5138:294-1313(-)
MENLGRSLYRITLRELRELVKIQSSVWKDSRLVHHKSDESYIRLRSDINVRKLGTCSYSRNGLLNQTSSNLHNLFPSTVVDRILRKSNDLEAMENVQQESDEKLRKYKFQICIEKPMSTRVIQTAIKSLFCDPVLSDSDLQDRFQSAILSIRLISDQIQIAKTSSYAVTLSQNPLHSSSSVTGVTEEHVPIVSVEANSKWVLHAEPNIFVYRICIQNVSRIPFRVQGRHWIVKSEDSIFAEVPKGSPGVIGQTPILEPGAAFEYHSSTTIPPYSTHGSMSGSFQLIFPPYIEEGLKITASGDRSADSGAQGDHESVESKIETYTLDAKVAPFALIPDRR